MDTLLKKPHPAVMLGLNKFFLKLKRVKSQSGFTLMEVLISFSLMMILAYGVMSLVQNQSHEVRIISEKMAAKDMETRLKSSLLNGNYCGCLFRGFALNTTLAVPAFTAPMTVVPAAFTLPIPPMPALCASIGTNTVPPVGSKIPNTNLQISSIYLANVVNLGGGSYVADLTIAFDPSQMIRAIKPVSATVNFSVDTTDPPAAQRFVGCSVVGGGETIIEPKCTGGGCVPPGCPAGWTDLGILNHESADYANNANYLGGAFPSVTLIYGSYSNNSRYCMAPSLLTVIEPKCTGGGCVPDACPAGWTDLAILSSYQTGRTTLTNLRHCVK